MPGIGTTTICSMAVWSMSSAVLSANRLSATTTRAPQSDSTCSSSRPVYSGLTVTTTPPALNIPCWQERNEGEFPMTMATRSPRFNPQSSSAPAKRFALRFNSSYVVGIPMMVAATPWGISRTRSSKRRWQGTPGRSM